MRLLTAVPKPPVHVAAPDFLAWLRQTQPCLVCGAQTDWGFDRIEAAHLESRRYGDAGNAVALCGSRHHREGPHSLHQMGREAFEAYWHVLLDTEARKAWVAFQGAPAW